MVGVIYIKIFSVKANTRIIFRQGSINSDYLFHLYDLFKEFTFLVLRSQQSQIKKRKRVDII